MLGMITVRPSTKVSYAITETVGPTEYNSCSHIPGIDYFISIFKDVKKYQIF